MSYWLQIARPSTDAFNRHLGHCAGHRRVIQYASPTTGGPLVVGHRVREGQRLISHPVARLDAPPNAAGCQWIQNRTGSGQRDQIPVSAHGELCCCNKINPEYRWPSAVDSPRESVLLPIHPRPVRCVFPIICSVYGGNGQAAAAASVSACVSSSGSAPPDRREYWPCLPSPPPHCS